MRIEQIDLCCSQVWKVAVQKNKCIEAAEIKLLISLAGYILHDPKNNEKIKT